MEVRPEPRVVIILISGVQNESYVDNKIRIAMMMMKQMNESRMMQPRVE